MSKESALALIPSTPTSVLPVEAPALETPKEPTQLDSTRFSHLAKKEQQLQKEREAFKLEQRLINEEKEKLKPIHEKLQKFEELKTKDMVAAIKSLGFSDTDVMNYFASLEDTSTPEEKATKAAQSEIQKFKDEQSRLQAEAQAKSGERLVNDFRKNVDTLITSDKDKFEYCNYYDTEAKALIEETMLSVIEQSEGNDVDYKEVVQLVEDFYEERDKSMNSLKKRNPIKETPIEQQIEQKIEEKLSERPKSNSNALSSKASASISSTQSPKNESREDKKARLAAKLASFGRQ